LISYLLKEAKGNAYGILVGKPEGERAHLKELGVDGRRILKWILKQ
jgi:hypothetical protein